MTSKKRKVKSMRGVEIHTPKKGKPTVYIRYMANGEQKREWIGESLKASEAGLPGPPNRDLTIEKARRILRERRNEIRDARAQEIKWLSPKDRKQEVEKDAAVAHEARRPFLFEKASKRFLDACADDYARPEEVKAEFRILGMYFNCRYLDELTRRDILDYRQARVSKTGPFESWPYKVGMRPPMKEIHKLSALYWYLIETEERDIKNPCLALQRGRRTKATAYRCEHKAVIPTPEQRRAIFTADPVRKTTARVWRPVKPEHRAFWIVTYYAAARPESETAGLRHRDLRLPEPGKVRTLDGQPAIGTATFRDTKTGDNRTIPLHPEAAGALRGIMLEEPDDPTKREAWAETPIFRRRDGSCWDRNTYRKAWGATIEAVRKDHPDLTGMWVRDLRKAAITDMRACGTDAAVAAKVAGHSAAMSDHYTQATDPLAVRAVLSLGAKSYTDLYTEPSDEKGKKKAAS